MGKDDYIQLRVTKAEKEKIKKQAKKAGFDSVSSFILWLIRKASK